MEYIEPAPVEVKPHSKRNKIIIGSVAGALALGAIATGYYFAITKIFRNYDNIGLFKYSYRTDLPEGVLPEVVINEINPNAKVPETLRIPERLSGYKVTSIAESAFEHTLGLKKIIFPDTIKSIGVKAFYECSDLESFNFPKSLESIGTEAFHETKWFDNIDEGEVAISSILYSFKGEMDSHSAIVASEDSEAISHYNGTIVNIGKYTALSKGIFKDKRGLEYAEFPAEITSIPESTFENCIDLQTVVLGKGIKEIHDAAFAGCTSLYEIEFPNELSKIGMYAFSETALENSLVLPETLLSIGDGAFLGCTELTSVTLPSNINKISGSLFNGCSKLATVNLASDEYTIESKIESIGPSAFKGTKITSFTVPFNVSTIQSGAFSECSELVEVRLYNNTTGNKAKYLYEDPELNIREERESSKYQGVQLIEQNVFAKSEKFESLVLVDKNNTAETLSNEVNFPITLSGLGSVSSQSSVFSETNISKVNFRFDLSKINIADATLKETFTNDIKKSLLSSINPNLFENCKNLQSVVFGSDSENTITKISNYAFAGCTALTSIDIPDVVSEVSAGAFKGCTSLSSVDFPTSTQVIAVSTFEGCTSLTTFTIKENSVIMQIGFKAFANSGLTTLNILPKGDKVIKIESDSLSGSGISESTGSINVDPEMVELYKTSNNWSVYAAIIH